MRALQSADFWMLQFQEERGIQAGEGAAAQPEAPAEPWAEDTASISRKATLAGNGGVEAALVESSDTLRQMHLYFSIVWKALPVFTA